MVGIFKPSYDALEKVFAFCQTPASPPFYKTVEHPRFQKKI
jgi:hypothetical protein